MFTQGKGLEILNLEGSRANRKLFSNLTFNLAPGCCIQVKGTNGAGKSSLLKILVGLLPATAGKIYWQSRCITFPDYQYAQDIVYLGQQNGIQARLTVFENLKYWLAIRGLVGKESAFAIQDALHYWGLGNVGLVRCNRLSAGQCQRLALAKLVLTSAKLWILDEPCNALDREAVHLFEILLEDHLKNTGSAVIVSHLPFNLKQAYAHKVVQLGEET